MDLHHCRSALDTSFSLSWQWHGHDHGFDNMDMIMDLTMLEFMYLLKMACRSSWSASASGLNCPKSQILIAPSSDPEANQSPSGLTASDFTLALWPLMVIILVNYCNYLIITCESMKNFSRAHVPDFQLSVTVGGENVSDIGKEGSSLIKKSLSNLNVINYKIW